MADQQGTAPGINNVAVELGKVGKHGAVEVDQASPTAKPAAVEVKLLLSEYSRCTRSRLNGAHHPWATTLPCRTIIRLWGSIAGADSTASRNAAIPAGSTP